MPPQPAGVASELAVIAFAIPYVRSRKLYLVEMPNAWNFAMGITAWVRLIALGYLLGFPMVRVVVRVLPSFADQGLALGCRARH